MQTNIIQEQDLITVMISTNIDTHLLITPITYNRFTKGIVIINEMK